MKPQPTQAPLAEAEIENIIQGVIAGHRMADHEPDDFDIELARRYLRDEISIDDAIVAAKAQIKIDAK